MNFLSIIGDVAAIAANPVLGLAKVAADLAPDIADLFGDDDATKAVERVANTVKALTGTSDPDKAREALADPNLLAQLRSQAQAFAHAENMAKLTATVAAMKASYDDRKDARNRDLEMNRAGRRNYRADALVALAVIGIIACVITLVVGKVDGNTAVGGFIVSVGMLLAGKVGTAFDFEFGGSSTEKETRAMLAQAPKLEK